VTTNHSDPNRDQPSRLDQRLTEEAQKALRALLDQFPDLRTVLIAFDYQWSDAGSLPAGTWLHSRRPTADELLSACRAVDKVSYAMRQRHDDAGMHYIHDLEQRLAEAEARIRELESGTNTIPNGETDE